MKSSLYHTVTILAVSFILISAFGLTYFKINVASAQNSNASLGVMGNKTGGGPSEMIKQLGKSFAEFNSSQGGNSSK